MVDHVMRSLELGGSLAVSSTRPPATGSVCITTEAASFFAAISSGSCSSRRAPESCASSVLKSITRQCTEAKSLVSSWTIAVLPSPIGMTLWAAMLTGSPRG